MPRHIFAAAALLLLTGPALAQPDTPACKRDLAANEKRMQQSLQLVAAAIKAPQQQKCDGFARHLELSTQIRETFERCVPDASHAAALQGVDDVIDATNKAIAKHCPPSPGMVRINAVFINRKEHAELPKPVADAHRCGAPQRMRFVNEPFENGRILLVGCNGSDNAAPSDIAARNASAKVLADEQFAVYLARDSNGRSAQRLTLPVLLADGQEAEVDTLPSSGTLPQGRNTIVGNWAPADPSVCRIHAEWNVASGKAKLVLWQEVVDCSKRGAPEHRTILDRR